MGLFSTLMDRNKELEEALKLLRDAFLDKHGCFPLDRVDKRTKLWNDAMTEAYRLVGQPKEKVSCGHSEPESFYRDPENGKHRTAQCEKGMLVVRGNGIDSVTNGSMFISSRPCPVCNNDDS